MKSLSMYQAWQGFCYLIAYILGGSMTVIVNPGQEFNSSSQTKKISAQDYSMEEAYGLGLMNDPVPPVPRVERPETPRPY